MKKQNESVKEKIIAFIKSKSFVIYCFIICTALYFINQTGQNYKSEYTSFSDEYSVEHKENSKITVYVTGEVLNPGLYQVDLNSRASAAIEAAGGMTENADVEGVNIAKILKDGDQVKVPALKSSSYTSTSYSKKSTTKSASKSSSTAKKSSAKTASSPTPTAETANTEAAPEPEQTLINLNCGNAAQYMRVSGVTAEIAANIIDYINTYGGFDSVDELQFVKGIDISLYNKIKDFFTV